jgi:predicted DNA-binding protein
MCAMKSRTPEKSRVFPLRMPIPLLEKIALIAKADKRTTAFMIRELVEESLFWRDKHAADDAKANRR